MNRTLPVAVAALAVAAVVFSAAPRAAQCIVDGVAVACPPDAKLSFQQPAARPDGAAAPLVRNENRFRPPETDPGRYPGPALTRDFGDRGDNEYLRPPPAVMRRGGRWSRQV